MVGSSNSESKSIRPKVIPRTTTQTSPGLATTDRPADCFSVRLGKETSHVPSHLPVASPTGDPQDPMQWLLCSSVGSDGRVLIPPLSMLTVPYKRQHNRPFHTAEDNVCVCWRSLFLTVLHFRAQVCRGHKNPNFPPHPQPKTKQKKTGEKGKK